MAGQDFMSRIFAVIIPPLSALHKLFEAVCRPFIRLDSVFAKILPYLVVLGGVSLFAVVFLSGASIGLNIIMEGIGILIGLVAAFFIYRSLSQERTLQFFEGEQPILRSEGSKTYAVVTGLGDKDVAFSPVRAVIHLTNLGIVVEERGSGEMSLFVPLDKMTDFAAYQGGIRVRYLDPKHALIEVMVYVEDRDLWVKTLTETLNKPR